MKNNTKSLMPKQWDTHHFSFETVPQGIPDTKFCPVTFWNLLIIYFNDLEYSSKLLLNEKNK